MQAAADLLAQKDNKPVFQGLLDGLEDCIKTCEAAEALVREVGKQPHGAALLRDIVEYFRVHGNPDVPTSLRSDCRSFINRTDGKEMFLMAAVKGYVQIALEDFKVTEKAADTLVALLGAVLNCIDNANTTLTVWGEPLLQDRVIVDHLKALVRDSVTLDIMDTPVRIDGCSHLFDQTTVDKLIQDGQRCPHCKRPVTGYTFDNELKFHIEGLKRLTDNLEGLVDGFSLM